MALTRKLLSAMGIEDDKAEQIINAHLETVNPLKQERDELKIKVVDFDKLTSDLSKANDKIKTLESSGDETVWKTKYDSMKEEKDNLEKEFNDYKSEITAKELNNKKKDAYKALLQKCGVSENRINTVLKVSDFGAIELEEDGSVKDSEALESNIKSEWSDFIGTQSVQGATVPAGSKEGTVPKVQRPVSRAAKLAAQYQAEHYGSNKEV